jgi:predicted DNA-binding transcriptional regulator YafY
MTPSEKAIRLLLAVNASPYQYTRKKLQEKIGLSQKEFKTAVAALRSAGISVLTDAHYNYAIEPDRALKELRYLAPLSEEERGLIKAALQHRYSTQRVGVLTNKLDSLIDVQRLSLEALRRPELEKREHLEDAIHRKVRVELVRYRSRSSNTERNRRVEAFQLDKERSIIYAYDLDRQTTLHFKLSRFVRVHILDQPWMYESLHQAHPADLFDIVDRKTLPVHLRLSIAAYSDLIERHPRARAYILPASEPGMHDLEADINHQLRGLLPFVLANWRDVTVVGSEAVRERVEREIECLNLGAGSLFGAR